MLRKKALKHAKAGLKGILQYPSISFNLVAVVLMLAMSSPLRAVVVPVELPEGIGLSDFYNGRVDRIVDSSLSHMHLQGVKDVVVIFTQSGKPFTPKDMGIYEDISKLPAQDLEPVRGNGWTDSEWNEVLHVWNLAYPRIKRIYGWPYCKCGGWFCRGKHKVKITKDPSIGADGEFLSSPTCWFNSEIKLKNWSSMYGRKWGPILVHEMAHAFRNYKAMPYDQFEEGHAEFVEVEVASMIFDETGNFWDYPYLYHNDDLTNSANYYFPFTYGTYSLFQQYNTDFVRTGAYAFKKEFWINRDLISIRYRAAGFSWWKLWFRVPTFFIDFNNDIYSRSPFLSYGQYKSIARYIVGTVPLEDNLLFDDWWERQHALRGDVPISSSFSCSSTSFGVVGSFFAFGDTMSMEIFLYLYWRHRSGLSYREDPVPSWVDVRMLVKDYNGVKILDTVINFHGYKSKTVEIKDLTTGSYKVHAYPRACPDLYQERVVFIPDTNFAAIRASNPDLTFIAMVGSDPSDSIVVIPPNSSYGSLKGFHIHEWPIKRARYTVYDHDHSDRWSLIIKDKTPYFIYPGGWEKVPPGQPQSVRVLFKDPLTGIIAIVWKPNEEVDMQRYKIVWTSYDTTGRVDTVYNYTTDTITAIGFANKKQCVIYAVNVYAIDRNGNVSGKSNTVIDGWWDEKCGPIPFMYEKSLAKVAKVAKESNGEMIKVYNSSGRLIYEGSEENFSPKSKGVFFIYKRGKVKKEVLR